MIKLNLYAEDGILVDDRIFCICRNMAMLYSVHYLTGEVNIIGNLPEEHFYIEQCSRKIVRWNDYLVITPYNAKYIHIYDMHNEKWERLDYPQNESYGRKYVEAFVYNDKVIMIGAFTPNIIELDMKTREICIRNTYFEKYGNTDELFCRSGYGIIKDDLYIALAISNEVMKINMDSWEYDVIKVGAESDRFSGIAYDGNRFWISPRKDGDVLIWDGGCQCEKVNLPFELLEANYNFGGIYAYNNNIFLHGFEGEYSAVINKNTRETRFNTRQYYFLRNVGEECVIGQEKNGELHIYKDTLNIYKVEIDEEILDTVRRNIREELIYDDRTLTYEKKFFDLRGFIDYIVNR